MYSFLKSSQLCGASHNWRLPSPSSLDWGNLLPLLSLQQETSFRFLPKSNSIIPQVFYSYGVGGGSDGRFLGGSSLIIIPPTENGLTGKHRWRIWNFYNNISFSLLGQPEGEDPGDPACNSWIEILMRNTYFFSARIHPSVHSCIHLLMYQSTHSFLVMLFKGSL